MENNRPTTSEKKFNEDWILKYGLEVSSRDVSSSSSSVTSVLCLFCRTFGREGSIKNNSRKRKITENEKYFTGSPWRADNFSSHLKNQHPASWAQYQALSTDDKLSFFKGSEPAEAAVTVRSFVQPEASLKAQIISKQKCKYIIDADIVNILIGEILLDDPPARPTNDEDLLADNDNAGVRAVERFRKNALKLFVFQEDDGVFAADVKSVLKMNLIIKYVSIGVSFRQASRLYQSVKEDTGIGILGCISDGDVANHCRLVCAINLQHLKELFTQLWAFSIAVEAGNNAGSAYLDLRMRCFFGEKLHNFHLLAIPMQERHTGVYQDDLIVRVLDVLSPNWRHQLIGVSSDGASAMTGCVQGTVTRLEHETHHPIFRIWCGAHQLDLVVKKAFNKLCDDEFLRITTGVTGHLCRQQNLIAEMDSACPSFVSTQWISMGKVLKWLKSKRMRLLEHFEIQKPSCTPPLHWWIVVLIIQPLVERVEITFKSLQGMNPLVCEQRQHLSKLERDMIARCNIHGPLTADEQVKFNEALEQNPKHGFLMENYCVTTQQIRAAIDEVGVFVQLQMDTLEASAIAEDAEVYRRIIATIAKFGLQLVVGVQKVIAERDAENNSAEELPAVLPLDLFNVDSRLFTSALRKQRIRLLQKKGNEVEVEKIDEQFRCLRMAIREETALKAVLQAIHAKPNTPFEAYWSPLGDKYNSLKNFCGGIACVMPGTSSVESDFSLINWTKDPFSKKLTDFSLESILHCKQHKLIQDIFV
jgi:hypothetical protein